MPRVFLLSDSDATDLARAAHTGGLAVGFGTTEAFLRARGRMFGDCLWLLATARPEVLHADGAAAVRLGYALTRLQPPPSRFRLVASGARHAGAGSWGPLTRRGLRSADRVVARTPGEAEAYTALGVSPDRVRVIAYGVAEPPPPPDPVEFRLSLDIPESARLILAAGAFDRDASLKDAAWAFDVLKYAAPDLHLVLVGDGPERERVERFARAIGFDDYRVRFTGFRPDLPSLLALAVVVWVTHRRGGVATALEAMAAGKPVVAFATPDLAEVVADGVTGVLVPPGDRVRMAAVTVELLADPNRAAAMGAAGRAAAGRFSVAAMAERFAAVYHDVVNSS